MLVGATLSMFALDLDELLREWRETPLAQLPASRPRGRVRSAMSHPALAAADPALPAAKAAVPPAEARALFDALVEDRAVAHLYDAPYTALAELFAALAKAEKLRSLDLSSLDAATSVYPADIRPKEAAGGLVLWKQDAVRLARAAETLMGMAESPPRAVEADMWSELVGVVGGLLRGMGAGMVIVSESP